MWNTRWLALLTVIVAGLSLLVFAACGDDEGDNGGGGETPTAVATEPGGTTPEAGAVAVNLTEYTLSPSPASVAAGSVTFTVKNIGGEVHEFVVIKTDAAADALPTNADGSMNEDDPSLQVIDEIEDIPAEAEQSLTVSLEAGNYVLICNLVEEMADGATHVHYEEGMHAAFTVTP
jgi:uncharacterized cupredoxin-like copper-binding protein